MKTDNVPTAAQLTAYWDAAASSKVFCHPLPPSYIERYFPPRATVLDVGCGRGRLAKHLAKQGFSVAGTDTSFAMLRGARREVPGCEFRQCSDTIPWNDDTFDVALLVTVLTSAPSEQDQQQLVREIKRVLKPRGYVFVSDMPLQWSRRYLARYQEGSDRYGQYGVFDLPDGGTVRHHDLHRFLQLMSGLTCLELETHEVQTMNGNTAQGFRYLGRL